MVNTEEIEHHMLHVFGLSRNMYLVNDHGLVTVYDDVKFVVPTSMEKLPVQFHTVHGNFDVSHAGLTSMWGMPRTVGMNFNVNYNKLKSLAGGPDHVEGSYNAHHNTPLADLGSSATVVMGDFDAENCGLTTLVGCPQVNGEIWVRMNPILSLQGVPANCEGLFVNYHPDLAVLAGLIATNISFSNKRYHMKTNDRMFEFDQIIHKYEGKGKSGVLNCALELKKAGFEGNAKW